MNRLQFVPFTCAVVALTMSLAAPGRAQDTTLTVTETGQVGIGTTTPLEKLEVDGGSMRIVNSGETNNLVDRPFLFLNAEAEESNYGGGLIWQKEGINQLELFYWDQGKGLFLWNPEGGPKMYFERDGYFRAHNLIESWVGFRANRFPEGGTAWEILSTGVNNTEGPGKLLILDTKVGPRVAIDSMGYVGIGTEFPEHPLQMGSGAHVTQGGVWENASSRALKENIRPVTVDEATEALLALEPVKYNYKVEQGEEYVGFIAEDVPDIVATTDRTSLSPMDVIAILTRVVQEQQLRLDELESRLSDR